MDNFLIDNVIEKVDGQGKRLDQNEILLTEMKETVSGISDQTTNLKNLTVLVGQVQERMTQIFWPVEKMNELCLRLKLNNDLLSNPVKTKHTVVHTAGKLGFVIAFQFLIIVSLTLVLFQTAGKLEQYKTNDLLWRYVKVVSKDQNLIYLQSVEKLHLNDPEKMESIVAEEELHQKQLLESKASNRMQHQTDTVSSPTKAIQKRKRRK